MSKELTKTQQLYYSQWLEYKAKKPDGSVSAFRREYGITSSSTLHHAMQKMGALPSQRNDVGAIPPQSLVPVKRTYKKSETTMLTLPVETIEADIEKVVAFVGSAKSVVGSIKEFLRN